MVGSILWVGANDVVKNSDVKIRDPIINFYRNVMERFCKRLKDSPRGLYHLSYMPFHESEGLSRYGPNTKTQNRVHVYLTDLVTFI